MVVSRHKKSVTQGVDSGFGSEADDWAFRSYCAHCDTGGCAGENAPQPELGEPETVRIGVYTESATRTGASAEVTVYGEVRPRVQIDVISEVAGRITAVSPSFTEGGSISAGEPLITIEQRDYLLAVSEAKARVAARKLELAQALADADVAKKQLANEKTLQISHSSCRRLLRLAPHWRLLKLVSSGRSQILSERR